MMATRLEFATFRVFPDGRGGWIDPSVGVGRMLGKATPSEQFARFLAASVADGQGCPVAIFEIRPLGQGRRLVAVVGDEAPPLPGRAA